MSSKKKVKRGNKSPAKPSSGMQTITSMFKRQVKQTLDAPDVKEDSKPSGSDSDVEITGIETESKYFGEKSPLKKSWSDSRTKSAPQSVTRRLSLKRSRSETMKGEKGEVVEGSSSQKENSAREERKVSLLKRKVRTDENYVDLEQKRSKQSSADSSMEVVEISTEEPKKVHSKKCDELTEVANDNVTEENCSNSRHDANISFQTLNKIKVSPEKKVKAKQTKSVDLKQTAAATLTKSESSNLEENDKDNKKLVVNASLSKKTTYEENGKLCVDSDDSVSSKTKQTKNKVTSTKSTKMGNKSEYTEASESSFKVKDAVDGDVMNEEDTTETKSSTG